MVVVVEEEEEDEVDEDDIDAVDEVVADVVELELSAVVASLVFVFVTVAVPRSGIVGVCVCWLPASAGGNPIGIIPMGLI